MAWQVSPQLFILLGIALVTLFIAGVGLYYRNYTSARSLTALMLAITWWLLTDIFAHAVTDLGHKIFIYKLLYPAIGIIPFFWVVFAIQYSGQTHLLSQKILGALLIIPASVTLLIWTNQYHGLFWSSFDLISRDSLVIMTSTKGPVYLVFIVYSYVLLAIGTVMIFRTALLSKGIYRDQSVALILAALLPWGTSFLVYFGVSDIINPTHVGFSVTGILLMWVIYRRQLLKVSPFAREIARDEIIDRMATAVIIVGEQGQIVDLNDAAERIIGQASFDIIGQPFETVLPQAAMINDSPLPESPESFEITHFSDGEERIYDAQVTPLKRGYGTINGQLINLNDVTERKEREEKLEQQRQRLQVTNRILRHDIRNDMNVILGNAKMLLDRLENDSETRQIIKKGEDIVELSEKARYLENLNREGSPQKSVIDISEIVEQTVADLEQTYPNADFTVERPNQAEAYAFDLIESSIKNIVENAVEHNDQSIPKVEVTATNSTTKTEKIIIEVADNGPGLPEHEREVLESGTETSLNHSSGLGLWLAYWIVTQSGGLMTFSENMPRGSIITIRLPSATSRTRLH